MIREKTKFDFSDYQYNYYKQGCPVCNGNGQAIPIHPEMVSLLCDEHYKMFRKWHDKELGKGNISSWF